MKKLCRSDAHIHNGNDEGGHDHAHGGVFGERTELVFAILSGAILLTGWLAETFANLNGWIPLGLYIFACACGGYYTVLEAVEKIRAGKFEIDFLMIVAAAGAAALGAWQKALCCYFCLASVTH